MDRGDAARDRGRAGTRPARERLPFKADVRKLEAPYSSAAMRSAARSHSASAGTSASRR